MQRLAAPLRCPSLFSRVAVAVCAGAASLQVNEDKFPEEVGQDFLQLPQYRRVAFVRDLVFSHDSIDGESFEKLIENLKRGVGAAAAKVQRRKVACTHSAECLRKDKQRIGDGVLLR